MLYVGDDAVNALKEQLRLLIDRPDVTEAEIQRFMEQHSLLIPTPYLLNHDLYAEGILSNCFGAIQNQPPWGASNAATLAGW